MICKSSLQIQNYLSVLMKTLGKEPKWSEYLSSNAKTVWVFSTEFQRNPGFVRRQCLYEMNIYRTHINNCSVQWWETNLQWHVHCRLRTADDAHCDRNKVRHSHMHLDGSCHLVLLHDHCFLFGLSFFRNFLHLGLQKPECDCVLFFSGSLPRMSRHRKGSTLKKSML